MNALWQFRPVQPIRRIPQIPLGKPRGSICGGRIRCGKPPHVEELGARGIALQGDVADDAACRSMVDQAVEAFGRLDVLINSAGTTVFLPHDELDGITSDDWHRLYSVNTMGPFQMMRAAAPP